MPLATPILIAAKTIPEDLLLALSVLLGPAARLPPVTGPMQFTWAVNTPALVHFFRYIRIDFPQALR